MPKKSLFIIFSALIALSNVLRAQNIDSQLDSALTLPLQDSTTLLKDSLINNDTAIVKSDVKTRIDYKAKDSIVFDLTTNDVFLYGETSIEYGEIKLTAAETKINWTTRIIEADYIEDSLGRKRGKPVFTEKGESYEASEMSYNFQTRKAYISGIITKQGDAYMQGEKVKKSGDELYIKNAKYTTCNLENPHFHIASKKLKVIPGNKVVSGPFNLSFREIKSPIGFLFGMFPQPEKNVSGLIVPSYGEQRNQGFFLRDGGYYFKLNDYIDARITGDIYTSGAYGIRVNSNYRKRYTYNGSLSFNYNVLRQFSVQETGPTSTGFSFRWSHSPQNYGTSRFSSSVNIQTNSYNRTANNAIVDLQRSIRSSFSSNINYSKKFRNTPFSMTTTLRHKQEIELRTVSVSLPELTFSTQRQFPFKKIKSLEKGVLGKLGFSHNFRAKNDISNGPKSTIPGIIQTNRTDLEDSLIDFNTENLSLLFDRAKIGGLHSIPISTSFNLFKFLTVSPSATYNEVWYPKELEYTYDSVGRYSVEEKDGFSRSGWYRFSTSLSTRLYGFTYFKKGKIKAIRHVANPNISFGYTPDFSEGSGFQEVQANEEGTETIFLSKYAGFAQGGPPTGGQAANLSFGVTNNIEMKVASKKDTITGTKKVSIFDNLSFSSGYNFLAEEFRLSNISLRANTALFKKKLNLSTNGTLDPYVYVLEGDELNSQGERNPGTRVDRLRLFNGQGLGQLQRMSLTLSTRFSAPSSKRKKKEAIEDEDEFSDLNNEDLGLDPDILDNPELEYILQNPEDYIDFKIPWNIGLNYNIAYSKRGLSTGSINTNSLSVNGDFSLTPKTKVTFRTGYNFDQKLVQPTNLGIVRDLHCWSLSFNVVPFGFQQSFNLRINAKSTILQDLKLEKRRSWLDNN